MNTDCTTYTNEELKTKVEHCINFAKNTCVDCLDITFNNGKREDGFPVRWIKDVRQLDGWDTHVRDWFTGDYLVDQDEEKRDECDRALNVTRDEYFLVDNSYYLVIYKDFISKDFFVIRLTDIKSIECKTEMD